MPSAKVVLQLFWTLFCCLQAALGQDFTKFPPIIDSTTVPAPTTTLRTDPGCPKGYRSFENYCYRFYPEGKSNWPEAEEFCQRQGGHLVWITSDEENNFTLSLATEEDTVQRYGYLWLGGRRYCPRGPFFWTNRQEVEWIGKNAAPSLEGEEGCMQMKLHVQYWSRHSGHTSDEKGTWETADCGQKFGSKVSDYNMRYTMCKVPELGFIEPKPKKYYNGGCEYGWCSHGEYCYNLVLKPKVWQAAKNICKFEFQSHLASLHSWADNNFTVGMVDAAGKLAFATWLGFNKLENRNNKFEWLDGTAGKFTAWGPGQPDHLNLYDEESCVEIFNRDKMNYVAKKYRGLWNDQRCDTAKPFLCMKIQSGHVPPPGPPPPPRGGCKPGWKAHGHKCYTLVHNGTNFFGANDNCRKIGTKIRSNLVSIHTAEEQVLFLQPLLGKGLSSVWIGSFVNKTKYTWMNWSWIDESYFGDYENWKNPKANPKDGCSYMYGNRDHAHWVKVNATECETLSLPYICAQLNDPKIPPLITVESVISHQNQSFFLSAEGWALMVGTVVSVFLAIILLAFVVTVSKRQFSAAGKAGFKRFVNVVYQENEAKDNLVA